MANYYNNLYEINIESTVAQDSPFNGTTFSPNSVTIVTIDDDRDISVKVDSFSYVKEVYSPCFLRAQLSIVDVTMNDMAMIADSLRNATVSLSVGKGTTGEDPVVLGKDYVVFRVAPKITNPSQKGALFFVTLDIYSRDKLLTLDKYSEAHLGEKLGSIISKSLSDEKKLKKLGLTYKEDASRLDNLFFKMQGGSVTEFIQPYLVQYNETFYEFISRVAARSGEFLYFEDGELVYGRKKYLNKDNEEDVIEMQDANILSIEMSTESDQQLDVVPSHYNYTLGGRQDKASTIKSAQRDSNAKTELVYNEDYAYDDYLDVFSKDAEPDSTVSEIAYGQLFLRDILGNIPNGYTSICILESVGRILAYLAESFATFGSRSAWVNKAYKDNIFGNASDNNSHYSGSEQTDGALMRQFASVNKDEAVLDAVRSGGDSMDEKIRKADKGTNLYAQYFSTVRKMEKTAAGHQLHISLVPGSMFPRVGQFISYGGEQYVVIRATGNLEVVKDDYDNDVLDETQTIDVIPYADKDKKVVVPPYNSCCEPKIASAQPAFVVNTQDQRYLGRVRVRYPWQSDSEDATPWVRTSNATAGKNAGVYFTPKEGDEVMVDYVGGDIERPYIVGYMYNKDHHIPFAYLSDTLADTNVIKNDNGQNISFVPGNHMKFLASFVPGLNEFNRLAAPLAGQASSAIDEALGPLGDVLHKVSGGIKIGDAFGLWGVEGNTDTRKVTINSSLGNITIDAFTGITITSPNGNVNIEAKNINLKASNDITLESGIAIKNELAKAQREKDMGTLGALSAVKAIAAGIASALDDLVLETIDLSLIRSFYELAFGPKDGTLRLKSHRYIRIESGNGVAMDRENAFLGPDLAKNDVIAFTYSLERLKDIVDGACEDVESAAHDLAGTRDEFNRYCVVTSNDGQTHLMPYVKMGFMKIIEKTMQNARVKDEEIFDVDYFSDYISYEANTVNLPAYKDNLAKKKEALYKKIREAVNVPDWTGDLHKIHENLPVIAHNIRSQSRKLPLSNKKFTEDKITIRNKYMTMAAKMKAGKGYIPANMKDALQASLDNVFTSKFNKLVYEKTEGNTINLLHKLIVNGGTIQATDKTEIFRATAVDFINRVSCVSVGKSINDSDLGNNEKWTEYVNGLAIKQTQAGLGSTFNSQERQKWKDKFLRLTEAQEDSAVWGPDQHGGILFSQEKDTTYTFKGGGLQKKENPVDLTLAKKILGLPPAVNNDNNIADENKDNNNEVNK